MMTRTLAVLASFVLAMSSLAPRVAPSGTLKVTVLDPESQALPGATVTIHNESRRSGKPDSQMTDAKGEAIFAGLRPGGGYVVEASFPTFAPVRKASLTVTADEVLALSVQLLSKIEEQVKVAAAVGDLPVAGRFYQNVLSIEERVMVGGGAEFGRAQGGVGRVASATHAPFTTAEYKPILENGFLAVRGNPPLTFGAERDTASWANVRRFLHGGALPARDAVDVTEMVNYFPYDYPRPAGGAPFSVAVELAECPWNRNHQLVRFGFRTAGIERAQLKGSSITLLVDVSGSMSGPSGYADWSKIALVRSALATFVRQLSAADTVSIVVYAGQEGVALRPTSGADRATILRVVDDLAAGGSTNGEAGLRKAYQLAQESFVEGGVNQVILITDGDFNIGRTEESDIVPMAKEYAAQGIFLQILGVGADNFNSDLLEGLTRADGTHHYLDSPLEAEKVLVEELGGNLVTVARDVRFSVDWNPARVSAYRLVGYENRVMTEEEYHDDSKTEKAGEVGSDHAVTVLVEIVPAGAVSIAVPPKPERRYQESVVKADRSADELCQLKVRYKRPDGGKSREDELVIQANAVPFGAASDDFRFAAAVATFALLLRDSDHLKEDGKLRADYDAVRAWAQAAQGADRGGYRGEFVKLVDAASRLARK